MSLETSARLCQSCLERVEPVPEPICKICGVPLLAWLSDVSVIGLGVRDGQGAKCRACVDSPPHFSRARSVTLYYPGRNEDSQLVPSIIRRHKYGRDQSLSRALVECLEANLPLNEDDYDLVIPVPLHRRRLWWRGFNQAALLGLAIARKLGCRVDVTVLKRIRDTPPQTSKNSSERRQNVRGAFAVTRPGRVANRTLLLVDDVMTTGATVNECARALLAAGARRVEVLTLARAV
jgi:ComF family protein